MTASPWRRARRFAAVIAGAVTASVVLSGCLYAMIPEDGGPTGQPAPSLAPDTDGIAADLLPFYEQELDWTSCYTAGFDCTMVTAPLDWNNPEAGEIELSVVRHHAENPSNRLGSLITNPGGPGAAGGSYVGDYMSYVFGPDLIDAYDIIGFDPRGVGESTAVTCLDAAEMDALLFDLPVAERGTPEWEDELMAANQMFADACEANSDGILPFISTEQAARDMDLLRGVLGDAQLNYIGFSYGTFLGATYAKLYPERVGRLVLDGAVDPAIPGIDVGTIQAVGFESALRAYAEDCLGTTDCPFRGSVDDAMADISALLASVDARPLQAADGRMLGADTLVTAIIYPLYSAENWPYLSMALSDVMQGDPEFAFLLADSYNSREDGIYTNNQTEAFIAYNCMDYPSDETEEQTAAADALIAAEAPTIAPYWSGPDGCLVWPAEATGVREPIHATGAGPILVIGTTNDPATPYEWSVSLAAQLSSGVLITRVGEGHTGYAVGNACVDEIVEDYLLADIVPAGDVVCD